MATNIGFDIGSPEVSAWTNSIREASANLAINATDIIPKLIFALVIILIGWIIGAVFGRIIAGAIDKMKVDSVLKTTGIDDVFMRGGIKLNSGKFIGALVKWFIITFFLVISFNILDLQQVNDFLNSVLGFLPKVIIAVLILLIGVVIADTLRKVVTAGAQAAGVPIAPVLGGVAKWAILIFAVLIALNQLGIADGFSRILFSGVVAMFVIAGGLAFGLGGKDAAARYIEKMEKDFTKKE